ncbi:HTH-type transcriptional regulator MalT [Vibrio tritonius]|uniref:HTH-type transcriptional regulator MalT n=1 Tax=Vibrio tritonius TaxID=1435069 RepID=A0ABS7YME1_9VIBR|nr:HTH-type transcriptional regulator MalT [Vibrio tritonius]MCA2016840.1 HTH-type transcriptional regulator MalT [Vibrio tritonius]
MLIPSKLTRPSRLHNAISRPKVLNVLASATNYKLALFHSPAGYGKTTMVSQWLANVSSVGWYNIDNEDNDYFLFINYLIQAINIATNNGCPNSITLAERNQYSSMSSLFVELFNEIDNISQDCYLVLDDYHLIDNEQIHETIKFFIKHMPQNITVVVTSRSNPPLGIANLRIRDLLIEIDCEMLAFDEDETRRFFGKIITDKFDPETIRELITYVEGWPAVLQLIALQTKHLNCSLAQSKQSILQFNHDHLWEYLIEEVFAYINKDTQLFLLQCSVLETFNEVLVSELTQRNDAFNLLEKLNRYGFFIHQLEGKNNWYRFHHLFAEFLAHERHIKLRETESQLQSQASRAWQKLNLPSQALKHAQKAKNRPLINQLLLSNGWTMFNQGELSTLESAINSLDKDHLYSNTQIPLLQAWLAQSQHRYTAVEDMLKMAEAEMKQRNVLINTYEQGQINTLHAQVAINKNNPAHALELAELALSQLDNTHFRNRIIDTSIVGEVNHVQGNLSRALSLMQQTEKLARQHQVYHQELWAILQQSEILHAQGYVQAAFELHDTAFKLIDEHKLHQVPLHEFLLRLRAQILWSWNSLEEAERLAYNGIQVLGNLDKSKHLHSYSILARISICRGEQDKASKFISLIEKLLHQSTYHIDWTANASFSRLLYWHTCDDIASISVWLDNAYKPVKATNHFLQLQWRNIIRAQIYTNQLEAAQENLVFLQKEAKRLNLVTDINRNLVIETLLANIKNESEQAEKSLQEALIMTNQTGMVGDFLVDGEYILPVLERVIQKQVLSDLEKHRARYLLKEISHKQRSRSTHFDEEFIEKLINHPKVPELVRTSPLTQREWQVLGLIYSGFSNEKIALTLNVAGTTIKTHIRNLYQKLNLENRNDAIKTAENLLRLMNY